MAAFAHQIAWLESPFHVTHSCARPADGKMPTLVNQEADLAKNAHKVNVCMGEKPIFMTPVRRSVCRFGFDMAL